jgi:hypothetical protein
MRRFIRETVAEIYGPYVLAVDKTGSRPSPLRVAGWMLKVIPKSNIVYGLPLIWSIALIYSIVIETLCFIYLAGTPVTPGSGSPISCIVSIVILMVLLIVTPILQTLLVAPQAAIDEVEKDLGGDINAGARQGVPQSLPCWS